MTDWATNLCTEIADLGDDDAIRSFCVAYAGGAGAAAWEEFSGRALREIWRGGYVELTFPDGSRYRDSEQGINRFFPPNFGRDDRGEVADEPWDDAAAPEEE